ncbi:AAA family ATPase [Streptomyces sp. NPDC048410]|uniref:AAA family ATPase n=1 Tax=Streptomyces sp. NPDC048410 TaxID=3365545 RepID=UPI00371A162A
MWAYAEDAEWASAAGRCGPDGLIGRDAETTDLRAGLARNRLVTVTGAAGVGKSALAAAAVGGAGEAGLWARVIYVRCPGGGGPVAAGALAARLAEVVLGPRDAAGRRTVGAGAVPDARPSAHTSGARTKARPAFTDLVSALRTAGRRPVLLLLDDADAVRTECAGLVQRLLMDVPGVRVLVTCRQALGLGEERVLRLAPLAAEAAVELFLARARATAPGFRAEGAEAAAVDRICRVLEGVPLAVELAAGQLDREPSAWALADRLERDQCWLAAPGPALHRHRSLRSAVGSAYLLCERPERAVWSRSSVFRGAFTEPTAAYLCAGAGVAPHQVSACLARLAAAGVLETLDEPGSLRPPRYRMTRAARDFGTERLHAAGEFTVAVERHVLHHRRLAEVAEHLWYAGEQRQAARLVRDNAADLTALVEYAARPDAPAAQVKAALATVADLWFWWTAHDHGEEGRAHLARLLPRHEADDHLAARARWLAAWLNAPGDPATARAQLGQVWTAAVLAGDDALIGRVAHVQGVLAWERGDARTAADCFRQAADTVPAFAPGGPAPAVSLAALAVAQARTSPGAAGRSARRALSSPGVRDDAWATALARYARAYTDHHQGHTSRAWHRAHRALATLDTRTPLPGAPDSPDLPAVRASLRRLLADIESPRTPRAARPTVPAPRTDTPAPSRTSSRAERRLRGFT